MKRLLSVIALLIAAAMLSGCMPLSRELHVVDSGAAMPTVTAAAVEPAVGDELHARTVDAVLRFPSADQQDLVGVDLTLTVQPDETLAYRLVEALLEGVDSTEVRRVAPEGVQVESVRVSDDVAVVDLSIDARSIGTPRQAFLLRSAIVNTLSGVEGIRWVDVLVAGRVESPLTLPTGAGEATLDTLSAQWSQAQAEDELSHDDTSRAQRRVIMYYPDRSGRYVVPMAQSIIIAGEDSLWALIGAITMGGTPDASLTSILPGSDGNLIPGAELVTLPDGRNVARLTLDGNISATLERAGMSAWQMYAALTCTFTGFLPGLDGIQVYVGSGQLARLDSPDGAIALEDGVLTRDMFEHMIGCLRSVYMTMSNGQLRQLGRAMDQQDALSPRRLLEPLFDDPMPWETDMQRTIPDGLTIDDLIGLRVEDGQATLNFSANFYAGCQRLNEQQERNLVYALVNTLTEDGAISSVRIQVEGQSVDTLVHSISLIGPLTRNPGLNYGT